MGKQNLLGWLGWAAPFEATPFKPKSAEGEIQSYENTPIGAKVEKNKYLFHRLLVMINQSPKK